MKSALCVCACVLIVLFSSSNIQGQLSYKPFGFDGYLSNRQELNLPEANFTVLRTAVPASSNVVFTSTSTGNVTGWQWSFPGGNPSTSTSQNPIVFYPTPGVYSVTLTVSNSFGQDTETKVDFIVVNQTFTMCNNNSSNLLNGTLFDSGGPSSNYSNNQNCSFLISPPCADSIVVDVVNFTTELNYDFVVIYDGPSTAFPVLFNQSGSVTSTVVRGSNSQMLITWSSDISQVAAGFQLNWSTILIEDVNAEPILTASTLSAEYNVPVIFTNNTAVSSTATLWDFGDGATTSGLNVSHSFISNGVFEVQMEVVLCDTSFVVSEFITVTGAPEISVSTDTLEVTLQCGGNTTLNFDVSNIGSNIIDWRLTEADSLNPNLKILILTAGATGTDELQNTISAISSQVSNYSLITSSSTSSFVLGPLISNADVVVFPENESTNNALYTNISSIIQGYISNGGIVIQCHPLLSQTSSLALFNTSNFVNETNVSILATDLLEPILEGVSFPITGPFNTRSYVVNTSEYESLLYPTSINGTSRSIAGYRQIGQGRAYLLGIDFTVTNPGFLRLFTNMLNSGRKANAVEWMDISNSLGELAGSESVNISVDVSAENLFAGEYTSYLILNSNDLDERRIEIPVLMHVQGQGLLNTTQSCVDFGEITVNSYETSGLWLYNQGCAPIDITEFNVLNSQFDVLTPPTLIAPNDSLWLAIGGVLQSEGLLNSEIEIISDLEPYTVCISAVGVMSGGFVLDANSLVFNVNPCGDVQSLEVLASNYSEESLNVQVIQLGSSAGLDNAISISENTFTLDQNATEVLTFTINSGVLSNGQYTAPFGFLIGNDIAYQDTVIIELFVSGAPCTNFNYNSSCPNRFTFSNTSTNDVSSVLWDFGDGSSSIEFNPLHIYEENGNYNVSLTACNAFGCETFSQEIIAASTSQLIQTNCFPSATNVTSSYGIASFSFGGLFNESDDVTEGYQDFSCELTAQVITGDVVPFSIETFNLERLKFWIDFNNDGLFTEDQELVYQSVGASEIHSGFISIPLSAPLNTPIRVRITSDRFSIPNACSNPANGQTEDYALVILSPSGPPIAEFTASPLTQIIGEPIDFTNLVIGGASSYEWIFEGADILTSTALNPSNTYSELGVYDVTLIVSNEFGTDTLTKENFITITNSLNICSNILSTSMTAGVLYDSGGPNGFYENNEDCSFLIEPFCADTIFLNINSLNTEACCDYLVIIDGNSLSDPVVYSESGFEAPTTIIAVSGAALILWSPDASVTSSGFEIEWNSVVRSSGNVQADFSISNLNPPLYEPVVFTNTSSDEADEFFWDFGEESFSFEENPIFYYDTPGVYNIEMIATSCTDSDTISYSIEVQEAPIFNVVSNEVNVISGCVNELNDPVVISNNGEGDLSWSLDVINPDEEIRVLMLTYGSDPLEENQNLLSAINVQFINYSLDQSELSDVLEIGSIIDSYDVIILPETNQNTGFYASLSPLLFHFIEQGGTVIKSGPQSLDEVNTLGLFNADFHQPISSGSLSAVSNNPITSAFPFSFNAVGVTNCFNITNPDFVSLITHNGLDVMGYREIGAGRAYLIGYDYFQVNFSANLAMSRAVQINNGTIEAIIPDWLIIEQSNGILHPGESQEFPFTINVDGLESGYYSVILPIYSNDPVNAEDFVFINVYVDVSPCPSLSATFSCDGSATLQNTSTNYESILWTIEGFGSFTDEVIQVNFPSSGVYEVIMEVCNSLVCVTDTQFVNVNLTPPLGEASCIPSAPSTCCNSFLSSLSISSGIHSSNFLTNDQAHYIDFTCSELIYLMEEGASNIDMQFTSLSLYNVYIDYNNDLEFSSSELVTSGFNNEVNQDFNVPLDAITGVPLRMRLVLDDSFGQINACATPEGGSVFDYRVFIIDTDLLPLTSFSYSSGICSQETIFSNNSSNAISYVWDFGDGNSSTEANPVHIYTAPGNYQVTLFAYNEWGVSELVQIVQVEVITDAISYFGIAYNSMPIQFFLSGSYDSYEWLAYDGQTSNLPSPTFIFTGQFVFLSVTVTLNGCEYTFTNEAEPFVLGIKDGYSKIETNLYPNPTNNFAYLELSNYAGEALVVDLLDVTGRLIGACRKISEGEGRVKFLIEPSTNGIFFVRVKDDNVIKTLKLIVNK